MPAIKLVAFLGELPKVIPRLLPDGAAQSAVNCRLEDGSLSPIRAPLRITTTGSADTRTIYKHQGDWLAWDTVVHAAPGPVADERLYYTGDGVPKVKLAGDIYPLALAAPATALTATLGGTGSGDVVTRVYVYTWVTALGEESEPCAASTPLDWQPGNTVTLSGFAATPAGRNITKQRIYRSQTGQTGTYLYLIAERAADTANYVDTIAVDAFQEPLRTADWNPPPDTLEGLTAMPNGMMAAFDGRKLYFCEPFHPHAWPEKYVLTTDSDIVGLGSIDNAVIIMTKAQPFYAVGSMPENMVMQKIESNWPCINGRGIVDLGFAICYPTYEGMVMVQAGGASSLITASLLDRDDWLGLSPSTMVCAQRSGRYEAFFNATIEGTMVTGSISIEPGSLPFLSRTDTVATAAYFDVSESALYIVLSGTQDIMRIDAPGAASEQFYWRSKEFILPYDENFGAIQIDTEGDLTQAEVDAAIARRAAVVADNAVLIAAGSIMGEINACPINGQAINGDILAPLPPIGSQLAVGVIADGVRVATVLATNKPARLPGGFKARKWEIDVAGNIAVTNIVLGRTMFDITNTP